jgi:predicted nucleotidyltransferase
MTKEERKALDEFVLAVRQRYGARLHDVLVFGSRARGDNRDDSDVDVAVIFEDADWSYWTRKFELLDMSWEAFSELDLDIVPWPVSRESWEHPERHRSPRFVKVARQDARSIAEAV